MTKRTNHPRLRDRSATHQSKRNKIGLLREITNGNLGNAAFEAAVVQHLHEHFPDAEIYGCCIDSLETLKLYNVRLFPLNKEVVSSLSAQTVRTRPDRQSDWRLGRRRLRNRLKSIPLIGSVIGAGRAAGRCFARVGGEVSFWRRSYFFLKKFRLLIVCGGGQLSDWWGGPWSHPYTLFSWATLARLTRTPLVVLNVGAEEVSSPVTRWFLMRVLRTACYCSYRDEHSKKVVVGWGAGGDGCVYPDLAFSLRSPAIREIGPGVRPRKAVGVSPMPYCDPRVWPIKDVAVYLKYLRTLASFVRHLIRLDYVIILFVSQIRMDPPAMYDLKHLILNGDETGDLADRIVETNLRCVDDLMSLMPTLDLVVASRMHGVLLSQMMCTPALAISYEHKVDALMASFGLAEFCVDIKRIEVSTLIERFVELEARRDLIAEMLRRRVGEYRNALHMQYASVFGSLSEGTS